MPEPQKQMNLAWHDKAACKGKSEIFFGPYNERTGAKEKREAIARQICATCPVLQNCRDHARSFSEYGFWGGESEEERSAKGYKVANPTIKRRLRNQKNKAS